MSEPFLDLLHRHALCKKHRGAGVAKIVEADLLQVMLLQKLSEVSGDEVGIIELAECCRWQMKRRLRSGRGRNFYTAVLKNFGHRNRT